MRFAFLTTALLSTSAFALPVLELEAGGGAHGYNEPIATFTGRVGLDVLDFFTPGVRVMSLDAGNPGNATWAVLGDLRVHTAKRLFQVNAGVGLGVALAQVDAAAVTEARATRVSPYLIGDVGLRLNIWRAWVGLNVGGSPFNTGWLGVLSLGIAPFGRD